MYVFNEYNYGNFKYFVVFFVLLYVIMLFFVIFWSLDNICVSFCCLFVNFFLLLKLIWNKVIMEFIICRGKKKEINIWLYLFFVKLKIGEGYFVKKGI